MSQVQSAVAAPAAPAVATVSHVAKFNFKTFIVGSEKQKELASLVAEGRLAMDAITVDKNDAGADTWKRNQLPVTIPVPVAASFVREGTLSVNQVAHLQDLLKTYIESKQKLEVDANTGNIVDWAVLFEGPYSQRKVAVKITAEMQTAALKALVAALPQVANEKVASAVSQLADKKFASSVTRGVKIPVLERINSVVLEVYQDVLDAAAQAEHEAVFALWIDNLNGALNPETLELDLSDFA